MGWLEYGGVVVALLAGLVAIRGETWNSDAKTWHRKLTAPGWITFGLVVLGFSITGLSIYEQRRREAIAALPIVSSIHQVTRAAAQWRIFDQIAQNTNDPRSVGAREILELEEFTSMKTAACTELTSDWESWKGDIDPRVRGNVEMLVFFCRTQAKIPSSMFLETASYVRESVCHFHDSDYFCAPLDLVSFESELTGMFLSQSSGSLSTAH